MKYVNIFKGYLVFLFGVVLVEEGSSDHNIDEWNIEYEQKM